MNSTELFQEAQELFVKAYNLRVVELTLAVRQLKGLQAQAANAYLIKGKAFAKKHQFGDADEMLDVVQAIVERN